VAGKTPKEAAERFVDFLKETLSCVTDHFVSAYQQSPKLYKVYFEPFRIEVEMELLQGASALAPTSPNTKSLKRPSPR